MLARPIAAVPRECPRVQQSGAYQGETREATYPPTFVQSGAGTHPDVRTSCLRTSHLCVIKHTSCATGVTMLIYRSENNGLSHRSSPQHPRKSPALGKVGLQVRAVVLRLPNTATL